jgi:thymidylate synthase (FAD)
MNIRSLFNFFRHRCCLRAQEEIRILANEMLKLCLQKAPHIFANAGPSCIANGKCPEGKMTCGKYNEMKEFYNKMKNNL